jgi:hypothetical protein
MTTLEMVTQEARPQSDWPYRQDWIVKRVSHWPGENGLALQGINANYPEGEPGREFYWLYSGCTLRDRPFSWRFDFTGATFD